MTRIARPKTKTAVVTQMLSRERGATISEMEKATGWKPHSVRAFLTGIRRAATLLKEERGDGRVAYCMQSAEVEPSVQTAAEVQA